MKLVSFSVTNFRSITSAHRVAVANTTVLLGKNNEGKSNILRALTVAMACLIEHAGDDTDDYWDESDASYQWKRDFPVSLQKRNQGLESVFRLEFHLDDDEISEFKKEIHSNLNGNLPVEIRIGKANTPSITVPKKGSGAAALSAKSDKIARYIARHIRFNYIPAVRTEEEANSVVFKMLSAELAKLEKDDDYVLAVQRISELQQPILDKVGESIKTSLQLFLPNIKSVSVKIPASVRRQALRSRCQVEIDDGVMTLLEYKGDGVKSLAALGLLKDNIPSSGASIIAIEEPESHLHPGAIHSLREVIEQLGLLNQVVLTTHCPLFVDRNNLGSNLVVDANSAKPAKDIATIRKLLGIRASDNLVNAAFVLVVEGDEDALVLRALLPQLSKDIGRAIRQQIFAIDTLGGATNLSYKLSLLQTQLCNFHVLLDNDDEGRKAFKAAESSKSMKQADITFVNCLGMPDSEFEDCFNHIAYKDKVFAHFGVDVGATQFRGNEKWSERMKKCFQSQGKLWDSKVKVQVKGIVAEALSGNPATFLNEHKRSSLDALVTSLSTKLGYA